MTNFLNIFNENMNISKMEESGGSREERLHLFTNNSVFAPINVKIALLHSLLIPYKELIDNANTASVRISISTVWELYVDFQVFL